MDAKNLNEGQRRVLEAEGNILVSASAGSGKTKVLVDKALDLIEKGGDIRRMIIMTFGRAAASEIKSRLLSELYGRLRSGKELDMRILEQIEAFPFADICTIDSFCYGLIKKYFAVIGADPTLVPLEPDEADLMLGESIDDACAEMLNGDAGFVEFAERYTERRRLDKLKGEIRSYFLFLNVQPDVDEFLGKLAENFRPAEEYFLLRARKWCGRAEKAFERAAEAAKNCGLDAEFRSARELCLRFKILRGETSLEKFLSEASRLSVGGKCLKKKAEYREAREAYNDAVDSARETVKRTEPFINAARGGRAREKSLSDCRKLTEVTLLSRDIYSAKKADKGRIDFADMGKCALKILADEEIRKDVANGYDYIFVDEYQDTNRLQEKLLNAVSRNNVLVVGDVKQAIYHFRYAEPDIFNARMEKYRDGISGKNIFLNENYRSRKEILDFVNMVCAEIMTLSSGKIDYRKDGVMKSAEVFENPSAPPVEVWILPRTKENKPTARGVYSVRDAETESAENFQADFVAAKTAELLGAEIYDARAGKYRKVEKKDIAILARKNDSLAAVAESLGKLGIPYSMSDADRSPFPQRELLVDFLRLGLCTDDVPLINVMTSAVFGFSSKELSEIRRVSPKVPFWDAITAYKGNQNLEIRIKEFLDFAERLRLETAYMRASEIMNKVLDAGLDSYFARCGNGISERIRKFAETASLSVTDRSAEAFIKYYDENYAGERPPASADSISLMTMHKSKGLQFPVVILPFAEARSVDIGRGKLFYADPDLGAAIKDVDVSEGRVFDNFYTLAHKLKTSDDEREELARLFYVAMTRAENKLVIIGKTSSCKSCEKAVSMMDFLSVAKCGNPFLEDYFRDAEIETFLPEKSEKNILRKAVRFEDLEWKYPYEEATVLPAKTSVTEITERAERDGGRGKSDSIVVGRKPDKNSDFRRGENGEKKSGEREEGIILHEILRLISFDLEGREETESALKDMAAEIGLSPLEMPKYTERVIKILQNPLFEELRGKKCYRERDFIRYKTSPSGEKYLLQGMVDLLADEGKSLILVDYKYSGLPPAMLKARYGMQIELYSEAVEAIWGKPVGKRILFNILKDYCVSL